MRPLVTGCTRPGPLHNGPFGIMRNLLYRTNRGFTPPASQQQPGGALRSLAQSPCGPWLRILVAPGLIAFVISSVVMSSYRSGPRWLMALANCDAAEMLGAF